MISSMAGTLPWSPNCNSYPTATSMIPTGLRQETPSYMTRKSCLLSSLLMPTDLNRILNTPSTMVETMMPQIQESYSQSTDLTTPT
jgi:hypothetical protein